MVDIHYSNKNEVARALKRVLENPEFELEYVNYGKKGEPVSIEGREFEKDIVKIGKLDMVIDTITDSLFTVNDFHICVKAYYNEGYFNLDYTRYSIKVDATNDELREDLKSIIEKAINPNYEPPKPTKELYELDVPGPISPS